jgi:hypothetical protein
LIFPELTEEQLIRLDSQAEAKIYRALSQIATKNMRTYYSVRWIAKEGKKRARDGEADFVVAHPRFGLIVIEVKGGGINYDALHDEWHSVDRKGEKHKIKDPVAQSMRAKYSILNKIKEHQRWDSSQQIACAHSVFFPDCDGNGHVSKPDLTREIVGYADDLHDIEAWLEKVSDYQSEPIDEMKLNSSQLHLFDDLFARSFEIKSPLSNLLKDEEEARLKLTSSQMHALDLLRGHRRVAISGGAGTGKTVLAVEKATRLANEGFSTLLTCYNRPLADHLSAVCAGHENLTVLSFHQICQLWGKKALKLSGRKLFAEAKQAIPDGDQFNDWFPFVLGEAATIVGETFDAIVCDEGQDFSEDFWLPIEMLLTAEKTSPFYIFFDDNQDIYKRARSFPVQEPPFSLSINCRNTRRIHDAAYLYYHGEAVAPPAIEGTPIKEIIGGDLHSQARQISELIRELHLREGVKFDDISVLIGNGYTKHQHYRELMAAAKSKFEIEKEARLDGKVTMDTVSRFKGLESDVVILWGIDDILVEDNKEILYVGLSRAKSLLYLVGSNGVMEKITGGSK